MLYEIYCENAKQENYSIITFRKRKFSVERATKMLEKNRILYDGFKVIFVEEYIPIDGEKVCLYEL